MKQLLRSPLFLLGLALLLLNDFVLKEAFGNALTGKLSDFAGMFIFPLFWLALFPKYKRLIFVTCGLFFVWWKSPMSQAAIDGWNGLGVFQMGRVVDYSDLWALLMLPLAWRYADWNSSFRFTSFLHKIPPVVPLSLACFAFIATTLASPYYNYEPPKMYSFNYSKDSLEQRIYTLETISIYQHGENGVLAWNADSMMRVSTWGTDSIIGTVSIEEAISDTMTWGLAQITAYELK
jgi:hypothetical protein